MHQTPTPHRPACGGLKWGQGEGLNTGAGARMEGGRRQGVEGQRGSTGDECVAKGTRCQGHGTARHGTGRDGTLRDGTGRDGTGRDGTGRDGTGRDGTKSYIIN